MKLFFKLLIVFGCNLFVTAHAAENYFLITHGSEDPYWQSIFQGANAAAKDLQVHLRILAPAGKNDIVKQVQYFDNAIAAHPAGIATTLPSETAFIKSLTSAKQAHIPVIAFDSRPQDTEKNYYRAYVGSDNEQLGRTAALKALKRGYIKQHAVILNPQPGHIGLEARAKGIRSVLKEQSVTVEQLDTQADASQVQLRIQSYLQSHPDTSTIFCLTSQALDPLGQMIVQQEKSAMTQHPYIVSFDNTPNTQALVKNHVVAFAIDQQPYLMGYLSVMELVLMHRHQISAVSVNTAT